MERNIEPRQAMELVCLAEYLSPGSGRRGLQRLVDRWQDDPRQLGLQVMALLENPGIDPLLLQLPGDNVQEFVRTVQEDGSGLLAARLTERGNEQTLRWLQSYAGNTVKNYLKLIRRQSAAVASELQCTASEAERFLLGGPSCFYCNGRHLPGSWSDIGEFLQDRERELRLQPGGSAAAQWIACRIGMDLSTPVSSRRVWRRICRRLFELDGYPRQAVPAGNGLPPGVVRRWGAPVLLGFLAFLLFIAGIDSPAGGLAAGAVTALAVKLMFGTL